MGIAAKNRPLIGSGARSLKRLAPALLLLPVLLRSTEHYLLPDQCSDARHTLRQKISRAEKGIFVFTAALHDKVLVKSVEKALKNGRKLTLVTMSGRQASFFAKYRNAEVRVLKRASRGSESVQTGLNFLLLDGTEVCLSSLPFAQEAMRSKTGTMQCTLEAETVRFYRQVSQRLAERSMAYLE